MTLPLIPEHPGELRPYQKECIQAQIDFRRTKTPDYPNGGQRAVVAMSTGAGKTICFAQFPHLIAGNRGLFVMAHRDELISQTAQKIALWAPGTPIGIEKAEHTASRSDRVVVASVQSLSAERLKKFDPARFAVLVTDEAHHATSISYLKIYAHFGVAPDLKDISERDLIAMADGLDPKDRERSALRAEMRKLFEDFRPAPGAPFSVGYTATPTRSDGRGLEFVYDEVVFRKPLLNPEGTGLIQEGYLVPPRGMRIQTDTDLSHVHVHRNSDGDRDFAKAELAKEVNTPERNALVVQSWLKEARDRRTIGFFVDVQHVHDMLAVFRTAGVSSAEVLGSTPARERIEIIKAFRSGSVQVLLNCNVASEGFDVPEVSCIIMDSPTRSTVAYTQRIGRGLRPAPWVGKTDCLIMDFVDAGKAGAAGLNDIFGLPPKLDVSGAGGVVQARKEMDEYEGKVPQQALMEVTSIAEVKSKIEHFDPLMAAELEPEVRRATKLAWVKTSYGYTLGLFDGTQIGLVIDLLGHVQVRVKKPRQRTETLPERFNFTPHALRYADEYAAQQMGGTANVLDRNASWRRREVTGPQMEWLNRLVSEGRLKAIPDNLDRGKATDLINAVKQKGAGGVRGSMRERDMVNA